MNSVEISSTLLAEGGHLIKNDLNTKYNWRCHVSDAKSVIYDMIAEMMATNIGTRLNEPGSPDWLANYKTIWSSYKILNLLENPMLHLVADAAVEEDECTKYIYGKVLHMAVDCYSPDGLKILYRFNNSNELLEALDVDTRDGTEVGDYYMYQQNLLGLTSSCLGFVFKLANTSIPLDLGSCNLLNLTDLLELRVRRPVIHLADDMSINSSVTPDSVDKSQEKIYDRSKDIAPVMIDGFKIEESDVAHSVWGIDGTNCCFRTKFRRLNT